MGVVQHLSRRRLTRCCLLVLLLFVNPASAQSNPTPENCGLPAGGQLVASANWTLDDDCEQTDALLLVTPSSGDPGFTLTINGAGHTIKLGAGAWSFLTAVDSSHTVNLNNVTIDGQFNQRPVIIEVNGQLNAEKVTFTRGHTGVFVLAKTANLDNVLFEDISSTGDGFGVNGGALNLADGYSVTLNNAVFRKVRVNGVVVHQGGTLTTTGCLVFYGSPAYDVIHSGVWNGGGTWSDSSTERCSSDTIGNGGKVLSPAPPLLGCRMPASALIDGNVTWTLTGDCVGLGEYFFIGEGATLRIRGNGFRLYGNPTSNTQFYVGAGATLEMDNLVLDSIRLWSYDGNVTVTRAEMHNTSPTALVNYGGRVSFSNMRFENNTGSFVSLLYGSKSFARDSVTTFRDVSFYNNTGGNSMLLVDQGGATLNLDGCIVFEGNTSPEFTAANGATVNDNRGSCEDPPLLGPVGPIFFEPNWPGAGENALQADCFQRLGAIGLVCRVKREPGPTIEVWGVSPESRGYFILGVMQPQVNALRPAGLVACSADGRVAVRVHRDRNVTISMGPAPDGKTHHVTMQGHLAGPVIGTVDTFNGRPCDPLALLPAAATPALARAVTAQIPQADGSIVHVVQEGDTLHAIALAYRLEPAWIIERNALADGGRWLVPGQALQLRDGG